MLESILAIASKEILHIRRTAVIIRMMAIMQVLNLLQLGFIDSTVRDMPIVIVDQDHSSHSRELVERVRNTKTFHVKFMTSSVGQARDHVRAGRARVAVVIPPDFHSDRAGRGRSSVIALVDGSDSLASGQALGALDGVVGQMNAIDSAAEEDDGETGTVSAHSIVLYNPEGRTSNFLLPGLVVTVLAGAYMGFAGLSLIREREGGNLERLLMTPVSFTGLMLGKLLPYVGMGLINVALLFIAMRFGFGVPLRGNVLLLPIAGFFFLLTTLALGTYLAAAARSQMEFGPRMIMLQLPMFMLCGYIFPLSSLPKVLLLVAYALPPTHMLEIMRGVCLRGAGFVDLAPHFAFLIIMPFILVGAAVRRFKSTVNA